MPAVLERGEQVEAPLERVAVAHPERPLELRVARHAPCRPFLSQKDCLEGLSDVSAVLLNRPQAGNDGREELVQAVRRHVAHGTSEEVALRGPQHGGEVVVREGFADVALEEEHEKRIHHGDVERAYAGEKNAKPLTLTGAGRDARVVTGVATNLLEEVRHLPGLVVAVVRDVTLEEAVHITSGDAGGDVDDREPVAQELVEGLVVAVRPERLLYLHGLRARLSRYSLLTLRTVSTIDLI